ncbi:CLUMA_CG012776, isoform A [Clunio marinus]|uniref:CLUMA_CG012776, isoform A n=1 Tax=Clunio marinus TaxID=568069 RepID=A0A1J1II10_9DIPT|nr:CLUMA_CG012776, isoform A [Clunio marinus]
MFSNLNDHLICEQLLLPTPFKGLKYRIASYTTECIMDERSLNVIISPKTSRLIAFGWNWSLFMFIDLGFVQIYNFQLPCKTTHFDYHKRSQLRKRVKFTTADYLRQFRL